MCLVASLTGATGAGAAGARAAEVVEFTSAVAEPTRFQSRLAASRGIKPVVPPPAALSGTLHRPAAPTKAGGDPAVALLHACSGPGAAETAWALQLAAWGYVVLEIDSFGPRAIAETCTRLPAPNVGTLVFDAYGALAWLRRQSFVDPERIAIMGRSHGATASLDAVLARGTSTFFADRFAAAVALQPYCPDRRSFLAPVLILGGERDDLTRPAAADASPTPSGPAASRSPMSNTPPPITVSTTRPKVRPTPYPRSSTSSVRRPVARPSATTQRRTTMRCNGCERSSTRSCASGWMPTDGRRRKTCGTGRVGNNAVTRTVDHSERHVMLQGKVLVAQGGGPTAVINESLAGVVIESRKFPGVERVYGAFRGVRGIVNEDFLDLTQETAHNLELVAKTPSSALGSTRDKPDQKYCHQIFEVLQAHGIDTFFYIGGNDSSDTLRIVSAEARQANYPLRCIHVPKTIDNDLAVNDHTPGYPSAARFVASAFAGLNLDNWALPGVHIVTVMGRHAGFLTAASALGRKDRNDGPHLIYLPEQPFQLDTFLGAVKAQYERLGRCIIAISEGVVQDGEPLLARLSKQTEADAHGNLNLSGSGALSDHLAETVKRELAIARVRGETLGYLQRSFLGCVSDVDQREAREVGEKAVQYAHWGDRDGSVTIHRTGFYAVEYKLNPLEDIAAKTRHVPPEFVSEDGTDVTDAFLLYLRPLLGSRFPEAFRLRQNLVPKILNAT